MNYVIYSRKSTESVDRQILSIDAQERELRDIATRNGLKIVKVFKESMSAKDEGRPVFADMIKFIKAGKAQGILTWKLDRLARNFIDAGIIMQMLGKSEIGEIRTTERIYLPSDNVLMPSVEFGMANQYVRDLSRVVKRGNQEKLLRGEWPNHAPFGYLNDKATKTVVVDEAKRKFIIRAFELYASGVYGLIQIADILYDEGLRTSSGKKVRSGQFHRMFANPFYTGIMERHGKYYKGNHEALISKALFDTVRQVTEEESHPRPKTLFFPLRGFLKCATCGCMLTASQKKGHDYYYCTNSKGGCDEHKRYMREKDLYPLVASIFDDLHIDEELVEIMYEAARERSQANFSYTEQAIESLQSSLKSLETKETRLLDAHLEGHVSESVYKAKNLEFGNERTALEKQIEELKEKSTPSQTLEPIKKIFLEAGRAKFEFLMGDENKKHEILKNLTWNLSVENKNIVSVQYKKQFEVIAKSPKKGDIAMLLGD